MERTKKRHFAGVMGSFGAAAVLLTFLSRSLYNYNLPVVTVTVPKPGVLTYQVEGSGELFYEEVKNWYCEVDGRIRQILAQTGDRVKKGQCLMRCQVPGQQELLEIRAGESGILTYIGVEEGMSVNSQQNLVLYSTARESGTWVCTVSAPREAYERLGGDCIPLLELAETGESVEGEISRLTLSGGAQEDCRIYIRVRSKEDLSGRRLQVTLRQDSGLYESMIPTCVLHKDSLGYYVLALEKDESVLGQGYVARRLAVDLEAQDEEYSAVTGIPGGYQVIAESTKDIWDGREVYFEGEDYRPEAGAE